jgi:hypothetical protein
MAGPEAIDWIARIERELEPLQRAGQRFASDLEQASRAFAAARDKWRPLFEAWRAFAAARERGDFRHFQIRLRLMGWMVEYMEAAKGNPTHRKARAWLMVRHLTPQQIEKLLPYMFMDMPDLRIPKRKGRPGHTAASTLKMVEQLAKRIERTRELPTTAAKGLLTDHGYRGPDLKGRADHLVRVWKRRALKSR